MRWLRERRKFGGLSALFALALQIVLSFGHIHPEDIYGPNYAAAVASAAKAASPAQPPGTDRQPHQKSSHNDDYCAICATINLLSTSFVPEVPQPLPPAFASQAVQHFDRTAAQFIARPRGPFQPRAPPTA